MTTAPQATAGSRPSPPPPPLRKNRDFVLLWSGAGMSFLASRVTAVAYPLLVLWHSGSPMAMSLVAFSAMLPMLLVQLPAGALVDRWDRRRLMVVCEAGRALALGTVAAAVLAGRFSVAHIAAVAFAESCFTVFYRLAERGAVRNVVPEAQLPQALAQNEARGRAAGLLGQPAGILLYTALRWVPFLFGAAAYLLSLLSLLFIRKEFQQERVGERQRLSREVAEGMRWLWRQRFLRTALGFVAGTNALFQVLSLAVILMIKDEGRSEAVLAVVVTGGGIGGMIGALTGGWWMRRLSQRAVLIGGMAAWAALITAVAFSSAEPVLLGVLFAGTSMVGAVFNVAAAVYQVRTTPDEFQGRVASTANLISSGTNSLGALLAGLALEVWGAAHSVLLTGAAMAVLALGAAASPALRTEDAPVPAPAASGEDHDEDDKATYDTYGTYDTEATEDTDEKPRGKPHD
ncbi:MFS transporter [Streptomyces sp. NBC_01244]|uniref:MFS transporter n=1 Tax=Streptomyces sp. NBC_01244 TaxID=2903797 RepID=UPI002E1376EF|nr:MFS transporter [Streptomyces sp. NBC_01244]